MIGFIVFGLFVGVLARLLLPGRQRIGLLWTLILGLVGSVVGGTIASYLGTGQIFELNFIGAIAAIVSSSCCSPSASRWGSAPGGIAGASGADRLSLRDSAL